MRTLKSSILDGSKQNATRLYICTWYRKQYPDNVVTSYEYAPNIGVIKGKMRRSGRVLVSYERDTSYEVSVY